MFSFQSPFHRGNGCNVSTLSVSGFSEIPFSPLFIGAMVVTRDAYGGTTAESIEALSVPFSSGQWL